MSSNVTVWISGFGPFGGVSNNPSMKIVEELSKDFNDGNLYHDDEFSGKSISFVFKLLEVSVDECSQVHNCIEAESREHIFVHFGVDSKGTSIKLEQMAYNNMTFRIPDEKGYQPNSTPIESDGLVPFDSSLCSDISLPDVIKNCCNAASIVTLSQDPGRFLCNYIYYRSLSYSAAISKSKNAVFIHIPPFEAIPMATQYPVIKELLRAIIQLSLK